MNSEDAGKKSKLKRMFEGMSGEKKRRIAVLMFIGLVSVSIVFFLIPGNPERPDASELLLKNGRTYACTGDTLINKGENVVIDLLVDGEEGCIVCVVNLNKSSPLSYSGGEKPEKCLSVGVIVKSKLPEWTENGSWVCGSLGCFREGGE